MTTADVDIVIQRALLTLPKGASNPPHRRQRPAILVERVPILLAGPEGGPFPDPDGSSPSNGKMERFHKTLTSECVRTHALGGLKEAKRLIEAYVVTDTTTSGFIPLSTPLPPLTTSRGKTTSITVGRYGKPPWSKPDRRVAKAKTTPSGSLIGVNQKSANFAESSRPRCLGLDREAFIIRIHAAPRLRLGFRIRHFADRFRRVA